MSVALHIRPQEFSVYSDGEMWQFSDGDLERAHLDRRTTITEETLSSAKLRTILVRRGIPSQLGS